MFAICRSSWGTAIHGLGTETAITDLNLVLSLYRYENFAWSDINAWSIYA